MKRETNRRKPKVSSAKGTADVFASEALGPHEPPKHCQLSDKARQFWDDIMACRPRECWSPTDLNRAAIVAEAQCDIVRLRYEVIAEGEVICNPRTMAPMLNPKLALIRDLVNRVKSELASLHVAPASKGSAEKGKERSLKGKHDEAKAALRSKNPDDEFLIPGTIQ